ncbi:MAG: GNAT family N-acetyltransferase [Saprospiraceae bacterium]|jgi:ribosomal protein S18 acetylase RimI-like enzyme|nr:GNAT family N-acetyltransferase [Saprospiraceae bacterium]HMS70608.1 GNAT family N-acetyltransferase [Saprospiraceae bacterium]
MTITTKDNKQVILRKLEQPDYENLCKYFDNLSLDTKRRFGPHAFDLQSVSDYYDTDKNIGYIAVDILSQSIVAYFIIKKGYLDHDRNRYQSYGINLDESTDCTFAPSVADAWQSCGLGNILFHFVLNDIKEYHIKRVILWAGVQADNEKAIRFYLKNNFQLLGEFDYNGKNLDMLLQPNKLQKLHDRWLKLIKERAEQTQQ